MLVLLMSPWYTPRALNLLIVSNRGWKIAGGRMNAARVTVRGEELKNFGITCLPFILHCTLLLCLRATPSSLYLSVCRLG